MSTIITTAAGLIILAGAYFVLDGNYVYASACGAALLAGYLFLRPRPTATANQQLSTRAPAALDAGAREQPEPEGSHPAGPGVATSAVMPVRAEQAVEPQHQILHEDSWPVIKIDIPMVGTAWIQQILPFQVGLYVPPRFSHERISGKMRIIVGDWQGGRERRYRLGPGGTLYLVDCGEKTFRVDHELQMPVIPQEVLEAVSQAQKPVEIPTGVFEETTTQTLTMISQQLGALPRLSSRLLAQATAGNVIMYSTVVVSINPAARIDALLRLFQQILLVSGQDPIEWIMERVKFTQRAVQARVSFTADDIMGPRSQDFLVGVCSDLEHQFRPFGLRLKDYGVQDIDFEEDVQNFRDQLADTLRQLSTMMTEAATRAEVLRAQALADAQARVIRADGEAQATKEIMEGEVAALGNYIALLKGQGVPVEGLQQLLLARALAPLEPGSLFVQLGAGGAQQTSQTDMMLANVLQRLSALGELKKQLQDLKEEES